MSQLLLSSSDSATAVVGRLATYVTSSVFVAKDTLQHTVGGPAVVLGNLHTVSDAIAAVDECWC